MKKLLVPRLYFCLNTEDPERHCERISKAFFARIYSDNLIKLNFYINNMPTEGLSELSNEQKVRIKQMAEHMREYPNTNDYFPEVQE